MNLVKLKCTLCGKEFFREKGRYSEAKKFNWKQYCSKECQNKGRTTRVEKACGNANCNNKVVRILKEFRKSKSGFIFCSQSCAAQINNKKYPKRKAKLKICPVCRKRFQGNRKYCSKECKLKALNRYTSKELIEIIKLTAQRLRRTPAKRELKRIADICTKRFGSWNKAINVAGLQPNRSDDQRMYRRTNTIATDGHLCDSISEALIDNWMTENNIFHKRNRPYPETNHKADWIIFIEESKIFVEYFGLAKDSPRYDRDIKEKQKLCRKYKIPLIEIYPCDLYPLPSFENKLKNEIKNLANILVCRSGRIRTGDLRDPNAAR